MIEFDNHAVGGTIRNLRLQKKMNQEVFSGFANISRSHLSMIETGAKQPNFETIWKIANAFGMMPSELVHRIEIYILEEQH